MTKLMTLLVILSASAFATTAPNNFPQSSGQTAAQYTFVDFQTANYSIKYDVKNEKVSVTTKIVFKQSEAGIPLFDLVPQASEIKLDGEIVKSKTVQSPDKVTTYKAALKTLTAGTHTLEVKNEIDKNVKFEKEGVQSAFWMSDLNDRRYLEQYVPSNIEFDQYKMTIELSFINTSAKQTIYTNGKIVKQSNNIYIIEFPEYFTTSSMFFHTATEGRFEEEKYDYTSISGRVFPVTVYSKSSLWGGGNVPKAVKGSKKVLNELEAKLGAWSHENLVIYIAGQGGMEHSGATITSLSALGHEITHSYFARGVMPIDGNSGWMDEAIASWRDDGYKSNSKPNFNSTKMAAHSEYQRTTDRKAYTQGANFMAYLNYNLKNLGGLEVFLSNMYKKYTHKSINTELFKTELETFSGLNFEGDFNQYIYGEGKIDTSKEIRSNPFHPQLSEKQLLELL
jgi:hypothetical protein